MSATPVQQQTHPASHTSSTADGLSGTECRSAASVLGSTPRSGQESGVAAPFETTSVPAGASAPSEPAASSAVPRTSHSNRRHTVSSAAQPIIGQVQAQAQQQPLSVPDQLVANSPIVEPASIVPDGNTIVYTYRIPAQFRLVASLVKPPPGDASLYSMSVSAAALKDALVQSVGQTRSAASKSLSRDGSNRTDTSISKWDDPASNDHLSQSLSASGNGFRTFPATAGAASANAADPPILSPSAQSKTTRRQSATGNSRPAADALAAPPVNPVMLRAMHSHNMQAALTPPLLSGPATPVLPDRHREAAPCSCDCRRVFQKLGPLGSQHSIPSVLKALRQLYPMLMTTIESGDLSVKLDQRNRGVMTQQTLHTSLEEYGGSLEEYLSPFLARSATAVLAELRRRGFDAMFSEVPLIAAASAGYADLVACLTHLQGQNGIVNMTLPSDRPMMLGGAGDVAGATALYIASALNQPEVIDVLTASGAQTEVLTAYGWTPLTVAASLNHHEAVATLARAGANLEFTDKSGCTPLMHTVKRNFIEACKALIAAGANLESRNHNGWTPLIYTANTGLPDIASVLLASGANCNQRDKSGWTPLIHAATRDHADLIRCLLRMDMCDPSAQDKGLWTALHHACDMGFVRSARVLIELGAPIDVVDAYGRSPLYLAAHQGHVNVCATLIDKSAGKEFKDKNGRTALMAAAKHGHTVVSRLLVEGGADINAVDAHGYTALMFAAHGSHAETCKMLLEHKASVKMADKDGHTAHDYVLYRKNPDVMQVFAAYAPPTAAAPAPSSSSAKAKP
ncbi:ankyrin repeat-containing domain protein [Entophlyctis helioformis]|nr:ankyrin repeat-containing domain protein [Entophlyctis helioformis]